MVNLISRVKKSALYARHGASIRRFVRTVSKVLLRNYHTWLVLFVNKNLAFRLRALFFGLQINEINSPNEFNFRRNIHRLEKGLSYPNPKKVFASDYIMATVQLLKRGEEQKAFEPSTLYWGRAVLENYFQHCEHTAEIEVAYRQFQSLTTPNSEPTWIPYRESQRPFSDVNYDQLYQLARRRRSVRHYLDKPVEAELIEKAMAIAALSPSACNRQSFKYLFFNERDLVKRLAEIPGGIAGYEVPSIVVIVGCYSGYFNERDFNAPVIDAMLSSMAFLFALETLNLSSVCVNWPSLGKPEKEIRKVLDLKDDEFVIMMIGIGYPSREGKIPFSAKRPTSELLLINERVK